MTWRGARILLPALCSCAFLQAARAARVQAIRVRFSGAGLGDTNSVLAYTSLRAGEEYEAAAVARDVKALQQSGRFSCVSVEAEPVPGGVLVNYLVESRPRIHTLEVTGADALGNHKVRELMELGKGDLVDESLLAVRAQKVRDAYRKKFYPHARLTWTITPAAEPGWVRLRIEVSEGKRANVKRIRFSGNKQLSARELRKAMKQRAVNWLSWITGAGQYDPDALETDRESLRQVYLERGYLDALVREPEVHPLGRKGLKVNVPVEEGALYRIGSVAVTGVTIVATDEVAASVKLKPGDIASIAGIEKNAQAIRDWYGSRGRIRTLVTYDVKTDPAASRADVVFRVAEGKLAYIREIRFRGNSRTKDKVLRRELAVHPGEIFNEVKVRTSERRLLHLNYFQYVQSVPVSTAAPDQYDLDFEVEEQRTGQLMAGVGLSSVERVFGYVELTQGNFDLFGWPTFTGGGQKLQLRAQVGTRLTDYELTFTEPWLLNRRLTLGVNLFQRESRYLSSDYNQKNTGGNISLGRAIGAFGRANLIYGLEEISIFDVSTNASEAIQAEAGDRTKSALTLELVRDTRNHPFLPTRGNRSSFAATLAGGPLDADTDIYGFQARSSQFFPLWFDHVLSLRGWAAVVERYGDSERVPIFDRLFLGGPRTIRGFKYRDVGPRDENGEPIGGQTAGYVSLEYTLPVAEKIRLAFFHDIGMVWEDAYEVDWSHFNSGLGFGVRFDLPGFPIQLDYTWPIKTDPENDRSTGRFSFWLGYMY